VEKAVKSKKRGPDGLCPKGKSLLRRPRRLF
jgi:hypothetical protein